MSEYLRGLPLWAPGAALPVGAITLFYDPGTDQEYRIDPARLGGKATVLYEPLSLTEAQGLSGNGVVAGTLYAITGDATTKWNAVTSQLGSGTTATILVEGLENYFDVAGTRLDADGVPVERVSVNVAAGTYAAVGGGGGGVSPADLTAAKTILPFSTVTANYTLQASDLGTVVRAASSSPLTVQLPANSDVAIPIGGHIEVRQGGTGQVTIVFAFGVTGRAYPAGAAKTAGQYASVFLHKVDTDTWNIANAVV